MTELSGRIDGGGHVFPIRVYHEDTDTTGMVYHANYLIYAERARTEMLRLVGIRISDLLERHGLAFPVRDCTVDYLAPARLDDRIDVRSRLTRLAGAWLRLDQVVRRGETDLVRLGVRIACVAGNGRPRRIPAALRDALAPYSQSQDQR